MLKLIIIPILLFLLTLSNIFASDSDVVINEVFPDPSGSSSEPNEFIELYNRGSTPVTITDWTIADTQGSTKTYKIGEKVLDTGEFVSFRKETTGISLNNSGDGVILKNSGGDSIDEMSYGSAIEDRSWSRIPDGTGTFVNDTEPTEATQNSAPPSSTPEPPTPTPTPSPTATTTAGITPTPTPKATPKSSPVATRSASPSASPQVLGEQNRPLIASDAGLLDAGSPASTAFQNAPSKKVAGILIGAGTALVLFALGFHLWYRKINKGKLLETKDPFQL